MRNGRPPTSHSMHSFLHQYTGSFKKPPLRRPHSVIGGTLGSFMAMPRNGSRLGEIHTLVHRHTHGRKCVVGEQMPSRNKEETCHGPEIFVLLRFADPFLATVTGCLSHETASLSSPSIGWVG